MYRVWNKINNKMYFLNYPYSLIFNNQTDYMLSESLLYDSKDYGDIVVMQLIKNKKDSVGNSIYQYDILYNIDNKIIYGVVDYCENRMGWALKKINKNTLKTDICYCKVCNNKYELNEILNSDLLNTIVIGNIFQHAKLLK